MSTSKNKAAVRRLNEAINKPDYSILPELFTSDYVFHITPEIKGPEGVRQTFETMRVAFPDYHETIERMVAEGDMVAVSYIIQGTFKGEMGGVKPTGKKFSIPLVVIARFKGNKQVEAWQYLDNLAWYRQLGIPIPPG